MSLLERMAIAPDDSQVIAPDSQQAIALNTNPAIVHCDEIITFKPHTTNGSPVPNLQLENWLEPQARSLC